MHHIEMWRWLIAGGIFLLVWGRCFQMYLQQKRWEREDREEDELAKRR